MDLRIEQKSDEKANKFREAGNQEYMKNQHLEALSLYNKSITFASSKKVRSLGYANRSAIYLTLGYYDECLENIELARQNDYPAEKLAILKEREVKCKNLMTKAVKPEDPWNFFKLSYPANEKIPWLVNCLEVRTTKKYGRGIYATKDLKAGDVISIEQPYTFFLEINNFYDHCMNCYKSNMLNLIPCSQTASMMFCSNDCMDKFYEKTIEMELALDGDMQLLSELSAAFGGYKKLDNFIKKTNLKDLNKTIFDYDLSNPEDQEYNKNLAMCFLSLYSKKDHSVNEGSRNIYKYISNKTANHLISVIPLNLDSNIFVRDSKFYPKSDGESVSIFKSLINHSCLPNSFFIPIENKIVGFISKPIKSGEQLFRCYYVKSSFFNLGKELIFKKHNFKCDCQECIDKSYQFKPFEPTNFDMIRNNFSKLKDLLKESWNKLNSGAEENWDFELQAFLTLVMLGSYATFPC